MTKLNNRRKEQFQALDIPMLTMTQAEYDALKMELEEAKQKYNMVISQCSGIKYGEFSSVRADRDNTSEMLAYKIKLLEAQLVNAVIAEKTEEGKVELGNLVVITINGTPMTVKMVGEAKLAEDGIIQVSATSPIGQAIYKKTVGTVATYYMGQQEYTVQILEIQNPELEQSIPSAPGR